MDIRRHLEPPAGRPVPAWAHYSYVFFPWIGAAYALAATAHALFASIWTDRGADLLSMLLVSTLVVTVLEHSGLCPRCAHNSPVLNPDRAVKRNRLLLRSFHIVQDVIIGTGRVPRLLGLVRFAALVTALVAAGQIMGNPWLAYCTVAVLVTTSSANFAHNRLSPWCPYCPRDDRDTETAPTPPVPTGHVNA
jgi:hypothetical protein